MGSTTYNKEADIFRVDGGGHLLSGNEFNFYSDKKLAAHHVEYEYMKCIRILVHLQYSAHVFRMVSVCSSVVYFRDMKLKDLKLLFLWFRQSLN